VALEALEEDRGADVETARELGDGADARLALGALDARHVGHVQTADVREPLLAQPAGQTRLPEIRSELGEGIVHKGIFAASASYARADWHTQRRSALFVTTWHYWPRTASIAAMPRDVVVSFAANLRRRRKELSLSQEQLGARANIQMADISRYESASRDPRISTVARLAEALDVPIADLLEGDGDRSLA
jgi:DNA-binding XRE family transcriptional regulator